MFLKELYKLELIKSIRSESFFYPQKQLVRTFSDAEKRPQTARKFINNNDRSRVIPGAVFFVLEQ